MIDVPSLLIFTLLLCFSIYSDYHLAVKQAKTYDKENDRKVEMLNTKQGKLESIKWKNLKIGHIVKIEKDQQIPADIMLISTSN